MDYNEEQRDEIEALKSIYENDLTEISNSPACLMIKLKDLQVPLKGIPSLKITFTATYPEAVPVIEIPQGRSPALSHKQSKSLIRHLNNVAQSNIGMAMGYTLIEEARSWLNENYTEENAEVIAEHTTNQEEAENGLERDSDEVKQTGGRWDYVIGLVGKPSAGKSTFFNACTKQNQAKVAAHPFTTIEPNISKAFYTAPCPCVTLSRRCDAMYGHNYAGHRYVPLLLKDVAGLVPGACDGKGRGNRFLNDLLDADVLMHVIDVSGCTDENGEPTENYDPTKDISWLVQEIHQWIFGNIMEKWPNICRRPERIFDMLSGYHANKATVYASLKSAGINEKNLATLPNWGEESENMVHKIVDAFLKIRFPIYLVLNKADAETAQKNIENIREKYSEFPMLEVSSQAECQLHQLVKDGVISYNSGDNHFTVAGELMSPCHQEMLRYIQTSIFNRYGKTNVQQALSEAVALKPPTYCYPVDCLDTLVAVNKYRDLPPGALRDCVSLKPGTTVEHLYTILSHYPLHLVAGDFIRAEALDHNNAKRILRKDALISESNCIVKIFTNRKISQVKYKE